MFIVHLLYFTSTDWTTLIFVSGLIWIYCFGTYFRFSLNLGFRQNFRVSPKFMIRTSCFDTSFRFGSNLRFRCFVRRLGVTPSLAFRFCLGFRLRFGFAQLGSWLRVVLVTNPSNLCMVLRYALAQKVHIGCKMNFEVLANTGVPSKPVAKKTLKRDLRLLGSR